MGLKGPSDRHNYERVSLSPEQWGRGQGLPRTHRISRQCRFTERVSCFRLSLQDQKVRGSGFSPGRPGYLAATAWTAA
jgi:hypothetical protein